MLKRLMRDYYEDTVIAYKWPQCSKAAENSRKAIIQKVPPILVLHLDLFECAISVGKETEFCGGLSLRDIH